MFILLEFKSSRVAKRSVQVLHSLCVCMCERERKSVCEGEREIECVYRCIMCANVFMQNLQ